MKKTFLVLGLLLLSLTMAQGVFAQGILWVNVAGTPFPCRWDPSITDVDGIPLTGEVVYEILLADESDTARQNPTIMLATIDTFAEVTLPAKGKYWIGVRSIHEGLSSAVDWADKLLYQESAPLWAVRWGSPPKPPKNVRQ